MAQLKSISVIINWSIDVLYNLQLPITPFPGKKFYTEKTL